MKWTRHGFPWVVAAVPVAAAILCVGLTLELPDAGGGEGGAERMRRGGLPGLQVITLETAGDVVLRERLQLLDPTPLFLPSALSSSRLEYFLAGGEAEASILQDFPPQLVAAGWESPAALSGGVGRAVPGVTDVIGPAAVRMPFLGLGRADPPVEALPERWAVASLYAAKTQALVERVPLPAPSAGMLSDSMWAPLELLIVSGADGIIGWPELISGSGVSEVDDYVIATVRTVYALGGGLRPGMYRLVVGR